MTRRLCIGNGSRYLLSVLLEIGRSDGTDLLSDMDLAAKLGNLYDSGTIVHLIT